MEGFKSQGLFFFKDLQVRARSPGMEPSEERSRDGGGELAP